MSGASREPAGFLVKSEGMQAANPNCAVRCSMDTPAVFDEEQIKCELAAQVLKNSSMFACGHQVPACCPAFGQAIYSPSTPRALSSGDPAISRSTCVQATSSFTVSLLFRTQEIS